MAQTRRPLEGIVVLDLGQIYNGPYAGFLLAMAGADVIKVEPLEGEYLRFRSSFLPLAMLNSNKRSITLNLKSERGKELLRELVVRADVLVENFAPTTMDRLGLGADVLRSWNPRLIYASGSGYGRSGPDRDLLAMDLTIQAYSGVMSVTGEPGGPPMKAGAALCDFTGGVHLYGAIVTALYARGQTGAGSVAEVAMEEAIYPAMASNLGIFAEKGIVPPRTGNRHGGLSIVPYNVYPTKDGHVAIFCAKESHWRSLAKAMGREDLLDDARFRDMAARAENMDLVDETVAEWTRAQSRDEVCRVAEEFRVPMSPVRDLVEVMNDPHMHERGMLRNVDHPEYGPTILPNSPLRFDGIPLADIKPSPGLGEHSKEIYCGWLGLSEADFKQLKKDGVV